MGKTRRIFDDMRPGIMRVDIIKSMVQGMKYVTRDQMREMDRLSIEKYNIPAAQLMENAGGAVAEEAMKIAVGKGVAVFCGYGNNGGDGLVAARLLIKKGYKVDIFFAGKPKSFSPESNNNLELLLGLHVNPQIISTKDQIGKTFSGIGKPGLIIDAIFGIGMKGSLDDFYKDLIMNINTAGSPVLSIDIPSGLDADTGEPVSTAVKADVTVTLGFAKTGFKNPKAKEYTGRVIVADIGLAGPGHENRAHTASTRENIVTLRKGKKGRIRAGHPWIYKGQILKPDPAIKPGDIITVLDSDGSFAGRGYYNPRSEISVRLMTFQDEVIDGSFFVRRIKEAAKKRAPLFSQTNAYRAVFSEADGLPGLLVDVYGDTVVFQVLTLGMERLKGIIIDAIKEALTPNYLYEKSVSPYRKIEGLEDTKMWWGQEGETLIEIFEGRVKFLVDIENGHKTGFYLDQRSSRKAIGAFSKGKKVLDLFCYTGGFSVTCAVEGASHVHGVDIKGAWLDMGRKNAALNGVQDRTRFTEGDAFSVLRNTFNSGEKFDMIIIDPPSFLKRSASIANASKGYKDLNLIAMKTLTEGGILCTFSCSHNMPNDLFFDILKRAARDAKKKFMILKRCHQAQDHPIVRRIPETEYLKGYFLKVGSE